MGCHFLLQGIFPALGLNPSLLHWQADSLSQSHTWGAHSTCRLSGLSCVSSATWPQSFFIQSLALGPTSGCVCLTHFLIAWLVVLSAVALSPDQPLSESPPSRCPSSGSCLCVFLLPSGSQVLRRLCSGCFSHHHPLALSPLALLPFWTHSWGQGSLPAALVPPKSRERRQITLRCNGKVITHHQRLTTAPFNPRLKPS